MCSKFRFYRTLKIALGPRRIYLICIGCDANAFLYVQLVQIFVTITFLHDIAIKMYIVINVFKWFVLNLYSLDKNFIGLSVAIVGLFLRQRIDTV